MHPLLTLEWAETGPGGEGKGHVWSPARMPRPLQQLRQHLPQWGQVCGEAQRILMRLHQFSIWRAVLQKRYNRHFRLPMRRVVVNTGHGHGQVIEPHDLRESSDDHHSASVSLYSETAYLLNTTTDAHYWCLWTLAVQLCWMDSNRTTGSPWLRTS